MDPRGLSVWAGWAFVTVMVIADAVSDGVGLVVMLALGPLISVLAARWKATFALSCAALVGAIFLGAPDDILGTSQHVTDCVLVALVGAASVLAAWFAASHQVALARAYELADHDALTGALTRHAFFDRADTLTRLRSEQRPAMTVAIVDIDTLKLVNDTYGHQAGDTVLRDVATRLTREVRDGDLVCRYGGDEFTLLLIGDLSPRHFERLLEAVQQPAADHAMPVPVTVSMGAAPVTHDVHHALLVADRNLYRAKHRGGNQVIDGPATPD